MDKETIARIKHGRRRFVAMAATYGLGVFNDSYFRQSCILLAAGLGKAGMKGWIMAVFTLPYILFAWAAGWLADRYSKRKVIIAAKALEVVAMGLGAYGIITDSWACIMLMAFTMGLQSCLFSPALNGSIPELYPACYVNTANSLLKIVVTAMILAGVSFSGVAMKFKDAGPMGITMNRWVVGAGVVLIALIGFFISFGVVHRPAADPKVKFPWTGPIETLKDVWSIRTDRLLLGVVSADVFVWFVGSFIVLGVAQMAVNFGWDEAVGGYLIAAELIGLAAGGVISNFMTKYRYWYRFLGPLAVLMGLCLCSCVLLEQVDESYRLVLAYVIMAAIGILGGMYMVPCEAFVQVRPEPARKGAILAAVNFVTFIGIFISGPLEGYMEKILSPAQCLAVLGVAGVLVGIILICTLSRMRQSVFQGDQVV